MSNEEQIVISQSLIKRLKSEVICPAKIQALYFTDDFEEEPTVAMLRGIYFETGTLGHGRDGKKVLDLPRLKSGGQDASHKRIDEQIALFKSDIIPFYGLKVRAENVNRKLRIVYPEDDSITLEANIDLISPVIHDQKIIPFAFHDTKLTGDLTNTYGPFSWGDIYNMDHTQAYMYTYIGRLLLRNDYFKEEFPEANIDDFRFYYWVFDYKPKFEHKIVHVKAEADKILELKEDIRKTANMIREYRDSDWEMRPSYNDCKYCPLKDTCPRFRAAKDIETIF